MLTQILAFPISAPELVLTQPLRVTSVRPYSLKPFAKDPPAIETLVTLAFYLEMINSSVFRYVLNITPVGIVMYQTMRPA